MDHQKLLAPYDQCDHLRFTEPGTGAITSGTWRVQGTVLGMVMQDVEKNGDGIMVTKVPYPGIIAPKASAATFAVGDRVYWDIADGEFNVDDTANLPAGYAVAAAGSGATEVQIVLDNAVPIAPVE